MNATHPSGPCSECGSVLFYKRDGRFRCAKHERPADMDGTQFYITKEAEQFKALVIKAEREGASFKMYTKPSDKQGETVVTQAEINAAVSKAMDSRINLKPFLSKFAAVAAAKAMTTSVAEDSLPPSGRDIFGRATKRQEDAEKKQEPDSYRDIHGRKRTL